jgi:hypothetical protein
MGRIKSENQERTIAEGPDRGKALRSRLEDYRPIIDKYLPPRIAF